MSDGVPITPDRGGDLQSLCAPIRAVCFDWGGTLMSEDGPPETPMALWPRVAVIPGARECLAALHGYARLCIATNARVSDRAMIELALERAGLLANISQIFCYAEIGSTKSQPEFWHAVGTRLGVPLSDVAMVGDSLEHDVLAPRRFGLQSVWFNSGGGHPDPPPAVPTVTRLDQFADMVRQAT